MTDHHHHQPTADDNHVWLTTTSKAESWSLSSLVSEHVLMAAQPQEANTAVTGAVKEIMTMNDEAEVINVEYLSPVSSRGSVTADADQACTGRSKRKRGNPWTEKEHRQFLQGLEVHGKGKWKKISRDFVKTRTPVQVASHAQKFFDRRNSLKPRKRKSINDITALPAAPQTITPLHVYNQKNHSTNQLQPMFSQGHHIQHAFGNHSVPATDFVYACLADQDTNMLPACYASYPPMLQPQHPMMWQSMSDAQGSVTYPNAMPLTDQDPMMSQVIEHSHVGLSMMEPQFHPYQSPFPIDDPGLDRLSVPTLIDGDYIIDLSVLEELLPPL